MNKGFTGVEIAEQIEARMPPGLQAAWHTHGYYGSVSHNVKAICQRYLGWFDGHPSSLWALPPEQSATRYVEALGGIAATVDKARHYADADDPRFAAELLKHAVFAHPDHEPAKELLASVYERLAYGAENATWRNFYLTGALELRAGIQQTPVEIASLDVLSALSVSQLLDTIAIRVDGPKAWTEQLTIDWNISDAGERRRMTLSNGALTHRPLTQPDGAADLTLDLTKPELLGLLGGGATEPPGHTGDLGVLQRLLGVLDQPDLSFPVVTP